MSSLYVTKRILNVLVESDDEHDLAVVTDDDVINMLEYLRDCADDWFDDHEYRRTGLFGEYQHPTRDVLVIVGAADGPRVAGKKYKRGDGP
jgi:hypothetical protein